MPYFYIQIFFTVLSWRVYRTDGVKCHHCFVFNDKIPLKQLDCEGTEVCDGSYCVTTLLHTKVKIDDGRLNENYATTKTCVPERAELERVGVVPERCVKMNETIVKSEYEQIRKINPELPELTFRGVVCVCDDSDMCNKGLATSIDRIHSESSAVGVFSITICRLLIFAAFVLLSTRQFL